MQTKTPPETVSESFTFATPGKRHGRQIPVQSCVSPRQSRLQEVHKNLRNLRRRLEALSLSRGSSGKHPLRLHTQGSSQDHRLLDIPSNRNGDLTDGNGTDSSKITKNVILTPATNRFQSATKQNSNQESALQKLKTDFKIMEKRNENLLLENSKLKSKNSQLRNENSQLNILLTQCQTAMQRDRDITLESYEYNAAKHDALRLRIKLVQMVRNKKARKRKTTKTTSNVPTVNKNLERWKTFLDTGMIRQQNGELLSARGLLDLSRVRTSESASLLHLAAKEGNLDLIRILLEPVKPEISDHEGDTQAQSRETIDKSETKHATGNMPAIGRMHATGKIHATGKMTGTKQHASIRYGFGLQVDMRDLFGRTPLHYASDANQLDACKVLVEEYGLDPLLKDKAGFTAAGWVKTQKIDEKRFPVMLYLAECQKKRKYVKHQANILTHSNVQTQSNGLTKNPSSHSTEQHSASLHTGHSPIKKLQPVIPVNDVIHTHTVQTIPSKNDSRGGATSNLEMGSPRANEKKDKTVESPVSPPPPPFQTEHYMKQKQATTKDKNQDTKEPKSVKMIDEGPNMIKRRETTPLSPAPDSHSKKQSPFTVKATKLYEPELMCSKSTILHQEHLHGQKVLNSSSSLGPGQKMNGIMRHSPPANPSSIHHHNRHYGVPQSFIPKADLHTLAQESKSVTSSSSLLSNFTAQQLREFFQYHVACVIGPFSS
eukprot:g4285.t1